MTRRYDIPATCPVDSSPMVERKTMYGTLRSCLRSRCTVRQWLDAKGYARGSPADLATRTARIEAHHAFDAIWKAGIMRPTQAYAALARALNAGSELHIAELDIDECRHVVAWAERTVSEQAEPGREQEEYDEMARNGDTLEGGKP